VILYIFIIEIENSMNMNANCTDAVKPSHVVTSIKQSLVLKGQLFLVLSKQILHELNLFEEVTCLIKPFFLGHRVTS